MKESVCKQCFPSFPGTPFDVQADFKLMCDNAMVYNRPETVYYKAAKKLLHTGFKMMSKVLYILLSMWHFHLIWPKVDFKHHCIISVFLLFLSFSISFLVQTLLVKQTKLSVALSFLCLVYRNGCWLWSAACLSCRTWTTHSRQPFWEMKTSQQIYPPLR